MRGSKALDLESCGLAKFVLSSVESPSIVFDGFLDVCPITKVHSENLRIYNKLKNTLHCS